MASTISTDTFNSYDRNRDGTLDENEMNSFLRSTGQSENQNFWDPNSDGKITEAEFETNIEIRDRLRTETASGKLTKGHFHAIDANNDGILTRYEWERMGLDSRLFTQYAGNSREINERDWDALVDRLAEQRVNSHGGKK